MAENGAGTHLSRTIKSPVQSGNAAATEAERVAEAMEDGGWWQSCTGCHETVDGHEIGHYPYSSVFRCHVGAGCGECGGIGVVWQRFTDADAARLEAEMTGGTEAPAGAPGSFQARIHPWMMAYFGETIAGDCEKRNHRFLEEALELVQACGCTADEAHQLIDYVFSRPVGEKHQEVGGVKVTLAALCLAQAIDLDEAAETELALIWTKVEQIRAKPASKPKHSPLPEHVGSAALATREAARG